MTRIYFAATVLLAACTAGDGRQEPQEQPQEQAQEQRPPAPFACNVEAARTTVRSFGERLRNVSLLAPDSVLELSMRESYGDLVAPELLASWLRDPGEAPGRQVSNPWPHRIEVGETGGGTGRCIIAGNIVHVTSADTGTAVTRESVTLTLTADGSRITAYRVPSEAVPAAVIERYYEAIQAGDYRRAYEMWSDDGAASGQSYEEFARGFDETATVNVVLGSPGPVEGAAGSRYVEVPVVVTAATRAGETRRFEGTYTLRRSVVDGATAAQRRWRIYSAAITER